MLRLKMITTVIAACIAPVFRASPTGCGEDVHCPSGFYCEPSRLFCQECLRCEDLKRKLPVDLKPCITSAADCGACLPNLVENRGGGGAGCVPPDTRGDGLVLPSYGWAIIVLGSVLCAVLLCLVTAYVLRNFESFKVLASTRASVHSSVETTTVATLPQCPPPYNVSAPRHPDIDNEESLWPFIKPVSTPEDVDSREAVFNQSAMVYNNPSYYVRVPSPVNLSHEVDALNDVSDPPYSQEDDPDNYNNNINTNSSAMSERTCEVPIVNAPTKLHHTVRQDSNASSASSGIGDDADSFPFTHNRSPVIINVLQNIAAVQQHNLQI